MLWCKIRCMISFSLLLLIERINAIKCPILTQQLCIESDKCQWYGPAGCRNSCNFLTEDGCETFSNFGCLWEAGEERNECRYSDPDSTDPPADETISPSTSPVLIPTTNPAGSPSLSPETSPPTISPTMFPTASPIRKPLNDEISSALVLYLEVSGSVDERQIETEATDILLEAFRVQFSTLQGYENREIDFETAFCDTKFSPRATDQEVSELCQRFLPFINQNVYHEDRGSSRFLISFSLSGIELSARDISPLQEQIRTLFLDSKDYDIMVQDIHFQTSYGKSDDSPPNIVFMMADDLGWADVGFQACEYNNMPEGFSEKLCAPKGVTPNIDEMASSRHSAVFSRFYTSPQCGPSRASFLTGRQPIRECMLFNIFRPVPEGEIAQISPLQCVDSIANTVLKSYPNANTFHAGKWHVGKFHKDNVADPDYTLSTPKANGFKQWLSTLRHGPTVNFNCGCFEEDEQNCVVGTYNSTYFWETLKETNRDGSESRKFNDGDDPERFSCDKYWGELHSSEEDLKYNAEEIEEGVWNDFIRQDDSAFIVDRFEEFLDNHISSQTESDPFMAMLWFHAPHAPVVATQEYFEKALKLVDENEPNTDDFYCGIVFSEKNTDYSPMHTCNRIMKDYVKNNGIEESDVLGCSEVCRQMKANYFGSVMAMDDQVGRVRQILKDKNLYDNTVIIFTSDNGPARFDAHSDKRFMAPGSTSNLDEWKFSGLEGGTRVPFILEFPSLLSGNKKINAPASSYDFFPTVLEIMGLEYKQDKLLDGVSLVPFIAETETTSTKLSRNKPIPIVTVGLDLHFIANSSSIYKKYSWNRYRRFDYDESLDKLIQKYREGDNSLREVLDLTASYEKWVEDVISTSPCNKPGTFLSREEFCDMRGSL